MLTPRESAKLISDNSEHVTIILSGVKQVANQVAVAIKESQLKISAWNEFAVHPKLQDAHSVDWIFLVDALNFSFWGSSVDKKVVTWAKKPYSGYLALCAAVNRAMSRGMPIIDPQYYKDITEEHLGSILQYDCGETFPMIKERVDVCREVGSVLMEKYQGSFLNVLKKAKGKAMTLVKLIVEEFPCFRDEGVYNGQQVSFLKRAQILVADIWSCFEGKGLGHFEDIDQLTMFADYRVPQVLTYLGALKYSDHLLDTLKKDILLENGCQMEVEIRGCSIQAVELIVGEVKRLLDGTSSKVNSILVDYYLWVYRREHNQEIESDYPFHKVRCVYY